VSQVDGDGRRGRVAHDAHRHDGPRPWRVSFVLPGSDALRTLTERAPWRESSRFHARVAPGFVEFPDVLSDDSTLRGQFEHDERLRLEGLLLYVVRHRSRLRSLLRVKDGCFIGTTMWPPR